jgi:phage gp16-like protein
MGIQHGGNILKAKFSLLWKQKTKHNNNDVIASRKLISAPIKQQKNRNKATLGINSKETLHKALAFKQEPSLYLC